MSDIKDQPLGISGRVAERFQSTEITPLLALVGLLLGLFGRLGRGLRCWLTGWLCFGLGCRLLAVRILDRILGPEFIGQAKAEGSAGAHRSAVCVGQYSSAHLVELDRIVPMVHARERKTG